MNPLLFQMKFWLNYTTIARNIYYGPKNKTGHSDVSCLIVDKAESELYQPLTAPSTMPFMICFWPIRKMMIIGTIARRAAVRIRSHCLT